MKTLAGELKRPRGTRAVELLCATLLAMMPIAAWGQTTAIELSTDTSIEAATGVVEEGQRQGSAHRAQLLPYGLLYRLYVAGEKEPRIGAQWLRNGEVGWIWEASFGGRVPLWRYGTDDRLAPEGFQIDVEGAAFTRIDVGTGTEVDSIDFRDVRSARVSSITTASRFSIRSLTRMKSGWALVFGSISEGV